jgi:LysM repeat protein
MKNRLFPMARGSAVALLLSVASCSHGPSVHPSSAASTSATSASDVDEIQLLLDRGDTATATKRLTAVLKRDPDNPSAKLLQESIIRDPKELLGPASFPYVTRAGDTMPGLAERFLGNRLKAFQLSRYNGITKPDTLMAGQLLRIPGEPPRTEEPAPTRVEPRSAAPSPAVAKPKPVPVKPVSPKTIVANPAIARQLRAAGLASLNTGNLTRAVALLQRAASLDPANPVIVRDLARAQRIAATVKAHQ